MVGGGVCLPRRPVPHTPPPAQRHPPSRQATRPPSRPLLFARPTEAMDKEEKDRIAQASPSSAVGGAGGARVAVGAPAQAARA